MLMPRNRMNMAKDAALGMTWLHESNPCILHRDLKPSNLLVSDPDVIRQKQATNSLLYDTD